MTLTWQNVSAIIAVLSVLVYAAFDYQSLKSKHETVVVRVSYLESRADIRDTQVQELENRMIRIEEKQDQILMYLDKIEKRIK